MKRQPDWMFLLFTLLFVAVWSMPTQPGEEWIDRLCIVMGIVNFATFVVTLRRREP